MSIVTTTSAESRLLRPFRTLDREATLPVRVAKEIERFIVENRLAPGHRMSSERELAEQFGVSRTVIREAMRVLGAQGLLEVRAGDGTYVRDPGHRVVSSALLRLLELTGAKSPAQARAIYEVRRPIEIAIAELAASRATADDVQALTSCLRMLESPDLDEEAYVAADVDFHMTLARATHNEIFPVLLDSMRALMTALRSLGVTADAREEAQRQHRAILERVAAHDSTGAATAMADHMHAAEQLLDEALPVKDGA